MTSRIVVAISGEVSAGKTTAGYYLKRLGFGYTRISWAIRKDLRGHGEPEPTRRRYQERGMELHCQSQRDLCKRAIIMLPPYSFHFVVDGLRWKEDVDFFRERYGVGLVHLHVLASEELRRTRFESRDKDVPFDEANSHEVEQEVPLIGSMAHATIINEGARKAFYKMIREAVELECYAR